MASAWQLQKALFERLEPVLAALNPPVPLFDDAPANTPFPYAEFSRHVMTPDDGFAHYLTQDLVTIAVYSEGAPSAQLAGQGHVLSVMETVRAALTDARLALADGSETIRCRYERADTARDSDGRTHVGTIIFSVLFEH